MHERCQRGPGAPTALARFGSVRTPRRIARADAHAVLTSRPTTTYNLA